MMIVERDHGRTIRGASISACLFLAIMVLGGAGVERPLSPEVRPDDPLFPEQVAFFHAGGAVSVLSSSTRLERRDLALRPGVSLDAPLAWRHTTGSRSVVVAVLDDGFFYRHEDIEPNVWRNPGECGPDGLGLARETNGRDDDGNGYVDDVVGWDFAFDDPDPDPYVFDGMDRSRIQPYQHSIPALGLIGAKGNNGTGVAGINWDVSLMLLKIGAQGTPRGQVDSLRPGRAAEAIRYAADNGARVINWSGFVEGASAARLAELRAAIAHAAEREVLLVVGAANDGLDLDRDENCRFPQCFDLENMLRVAEIEHDGQLVRYLVGDRWRGSNWGLRRVEIAAVATTLTTMLRDGASSYGTAGGTSNAGPVVAGVAALVLSVRPDLTARELKSVLLQSATPLPELAGKIASGGTVNAGRAVRRALRLD